MKRFDKDQKTTLGKVIIAGVISIIIIIVFSIPLDPSIPPLGDFLFPGDGIWDVPGDYPEQEDFTVPDLLSDVTIYRDDWGIAHIYGTNDSDICFALDYCHAQDRFSIIVFTGSPVSNKNKWVVLPSITSILIANPCSAGKKGTLILGCITFPLNLSSVNIVALVSLVARTFILRFPSSIPSDISILIF